MRPKRAALPTKLLPRPQTAAGRSLPRLGCQRSPSSAPRQHLPRASPWLASMPRRKKTTALQSATTSCAHQIVGNGPWAAYCARGHEQLLENTRPPSPWRAGELRAGAHVRSSLRFATCVCAQLKHSQGSAHLTESSWNTGDGAQPKSPLKLSWLVSVSKRLTIDLLGEHAVKPRAHTHLAGCVGGQDAEARLNPS